MNLFDRASFSRFKSIAFTRAERIKREGSAYYTYQLQILAATASISIYPDTQFPLSRKYSPLDWLEITNNDAVDVTIRVNNRDSFVCPSKTIRKVVNTPLRHITITNNDAAVATIANLVTLNLRKRPITVNDLARDYA